MLNQYRAYFDNAWVAFILLVEKFNRFNLKLPPIFVLEPDGDPFIPQIVLGGLFGIDFRLNSFLGLLIKRHLGFCFHKLIP